MTSGEILLLSSRDVRKLLTLDECIGAVERAFRFHGEGRAAAPGVLSMHTQDGGFHVKAGFLNLERAYFAAKVNGNYPHNGDRFGLPTIQGVVVLSDAANGTPLAVMDSREITSLRTAAATSVAAKYLARRDSRTATICGCGNQGRVQLKAVSRVCELRAVFACDASRERASRFAHEMTAELGIPVTAVADLTSAALQSDICVTCTPSQQPLLGPDQIRAGSFIAAVGADSPGKQEIHPALMAKCKIVCDIVDQCAVMGDLHHALEAGAVSRAHVHAELGEVVAGKKAGREREEEITMFDSTGMALQDVAAAAFLYEKAQRNGSGVRLNFAA
ncbi:MAG: ornithine cyclodeaminase family protein [Terriglobales bacterium]